MRRDLWRMMCRLDRHGIKVEWRRDGDDVECRVHGRRDVAGFGSSWATALGDLMSRLGV